MTHFGQIFDLGKEKGDKLMILYRFMGECVIYYEIRHLSLISLQIDVKLENAGKLKLRYPLWSDFGGEDGRIGHNHGGALVDGDLLV